MTDRRPELVWVRMLAAASGVLTAEVLSEPTQLLSVAQGDRVQFVTGAQGVPNLGA